VALVSWNTSALLLRCLRSLRPEVEAGRAAVWVVDNGSTDGSGEAVREQAPWAELIESAENLGFGAAVNLVARRTEGEWLAVANADVALEPGALEVLLDAGADARVGCVAPRLVLPDGTTQHSVYPFPTLVLALAFNAGLHRLRPRLADRLCLEGFWDPDRPRPVDWAVGAFLVMRRSAFHAAGGFDESQWMYAEDLDLGWRLRQAGWVTRYEPRASVLHESGAATSLAFGEQRMDRYMQATYAVLLRRRGRARALATAAVNFVGAAARVACFAPAAIVSSRSRRALALNRRWLGIHRSGLRLLSRA
jgi:GT2 family glycosyltransferase